MLYNDVELYNEIYYIMKIMFIFYLFVKAHYQRNQRGVVVESLILIALLKK